MLSPKAYISKSQIEEFNCMQVIMCNILLRVSRLESDSTTAANIYQNILA